MKGMINMNSAKILIADDDRNIIELLRLYIEKEGYTTVTASNGKEAIDTFNKTKPDLVVLDVMMPEADGWLNFCDTATFAI